MNNILTAVSVITLLGAVSCNKEKAVETAGSAIRFGVSTVYENGPATKTEYSGKDQNGNNISSLSTAERIDWVKGDVIRIVSPQATVEGSSEKYADYAITPKTDNASTATIAPVSNGLQWGEGSHDFFALYPSKKQNSKATISVDGDVATVFGTVPATQTATRDGYVFKPDMNYAYMYDIKSDVSEGEDVTLEFKPLVTTLEFTLLTKEDDPITSKLTSVQLSSTQSEDDAYLTGNFCAYIDEYGLEYLDPETDVTDGGNEITINLPGGGVQLEPMRAYTVTFLTLPMDQTELTLTLNFEDDDNTKFQRILELKENDDWIYVDACTKTYIWKVDAPKTVDTYIFEVTSPSDLVCSGGTTTGQVLSYKYSHGNDIDANRTPVSWEVEGYYRTEADAKARKNKYESIYDTYMTKFTPSSQSGGDAGESVTISYEAGSYSSSTTVDLASITAKLRSKTGAYVERGSSDSYWNLANPTTGSTDDIAETANTYIVNAPGYYCFPLVMGNGIKNGSKNTVAYRQTNFTNYKAATLKNDTSSPLLNEQGGTPTAAYIVWEEADMVALEDKTNWTLPSGCITTSSMTIDTESKMVYWLNFQITDAIKQGCIILAVTDENDVVMWSWTVWVTDYVPKNYSDYDVSSDLADVECTYDEDGHKVTFMPRNLGWVEVRTELNYDQMSVFVRLKQNESTKYAVMKVTKPEGIVEVTNAGHNPFYQWGRKDALMPSDGSDNNNTLSPLYGRTTTFQNTDAKKTLAETIQNPDRHYGNGSSITDWCSTSDNGWWCASNTTASGADKPTAKTIYDPSPAGYTIPRKNAFSGFRLGTSGRSANANGAFANGYYFWNRYRANDSASTEGMKTIFFPAAGDRNFDDGVLYNVTSHGSYWSAVPYTSTNGVSTNGCYLFFSEWGDMNLGSNARVLGLAVRPSQEEE